jgi:protein-tyrosine phosphatase
MEAGPLRRVIDEHGIRTIVCLLNEEPGNPQQEEELKVVGERGVRFIRVPMPGDGLADFEALDAAADAIAESKNRPVLVHCAGGENRTGAAYAAYRMKYCGWSFEKAIAEGERFGLPLAGKRELVDHLRAWYEKRAATRPATAVGQ